MGECPVCFCWVLALSTTKKERIGRVIHHPLIEKEKKGLVRRGIDKELSKSVEVISNRNGNSLPVCEVYWDCIGLFKHFI